MSKTPVTRISPMHSYDLQKVQLLGHHVRDTAGKCPVGKKKIHLAKQIMQELEQGAAALSPQE